MFTADQVWGLAAAADRINGGYFKEDQWNTNSAAHFRSKQANKNMVKQWLREGAFSEATEADIAAGREYRRIINTFTMKVLTGKISDFERQALRIAQMDEFKTNNMLEFAIVSCLPAAARREQSNNEMKREVFESEQLPGAVGDTIVGEIAVIKSSWSQNYGKFKVVARMGESFVDFWHAQDLKNTVRVRAKIKQHRSDNTTQLNYVKIVS
jgi:hypothetical protein